MIEIMVAIIISGIVISTAYSVFLYTHSMFFKFTKAKSELKTYFELSSMLFQEVENSKFIERVGEREVKFEYTDKSVNYKFDDKFVVRTLQEHYDTFNIHVNEVELTTIKSENSNWVDDIQLAVDNKGEQQTLSFHKNYGAITKIEELQ